MQEENFAYFHQKPVKGICFIQRTLGLIDPIYQPVHMTSMIINYALISRVTSSIILLLLISSIGFSQSSSKDSSKFVIVEDLDYQKACEMKLNLLLTKKDELLSEGGWTENDLEKFAYGFESKRFEKAKEKIVSKLKSKKVNAALLNEQQIQEYLKNQNHTIYIIRISYKLDVHNGNIMLFQNFHLYDKSNQLILVNEGAKFYQNIKEL